MPAQRFLAIWFVFALLYAALAAVGTGGVLASGSWPAVNQHLLQVRAWLGDDILAPEPEGDGEVVIPVEPSLDVTTYFRHRVVSDPREEVLVANLACGVREPLPPHRLIPVTYLPAESAEGRVQMERLECHVGSPLGPAFLLTPLRAALGSALSVQWLAALLGGLAVALLDVLILWWLEAVRGTDVVSRRERSGLLILAGLGTLWIWLVPQAEMWFFAQTVATSCLVLALVLAWRRRWLIAGLAFALAVTSRPTVALAMPLLLDVLLYQTRPESMFLRRFKRPRLRALALAAVFPVLLIGGHLVLNDLRFGSPFDFGYRFMLTPPELRQRFEATGQLSTAYLRENARWLLLQPPVLVTDADTGIPEFPFIVSDPRGMGVFFVTPAFLALFFAMRGHWRGRRLLTACWISLILVTTPALLYFNTGWVQWGGRYLLDAWPMWLMLAALGLRRMNHRVAIALIVLSVVSNIWAVLLSNTGAWPGELF